MHFIDIFQEKECKNIFAEVNKFVDLCLCQYNNNLQSGSLSNAGKEIFDVIWGLIKFSPVEVLLLDSPLIQRLKKIKQLGYAYQVYCNADYSRFSHTIGVTATSEKITEIIIKKVPQNIENSLDFISIIRIAALMHDAGHMFFSHVSESFIIYNEKFPRKKEIRDCLNFFNEKISDRAALHEMISVMIVNSEQFQRFLQIVYFDKFMDEDRQRVIIDYISGLIVGVAVDKRILPFSKIIKGSIDADRIDYLSRDSYATKVPLAVDMARLINKISIVKTEQFAPASVWNDDTTGPFNIMAIQYSAQRLVWQMSMARTILYQNVYFHHKKLTAEAILSKALENIFILFTEKQLKFNYLLTLTDEVFCEHFAKILDLQEQITKPEYDKAIRLINILNYRCYYKRIAGFSKENILPSSISKYELFKEHIIENSFSLQFQEFADKLSEEYKKILNILNKESTQDNPQFMFIQAGWSPKAEAAFPIDIGDEKFVMSTDIFKETPVIGEENKQKQYYLLTDCDQREIVYLALEKLLFKWKNFILSSATYYCAKFNSNQLNKKRWTLFEKGYYDGEFAVLPDEIMIQLLDSNLFNSIIAKYRAFEGANNTFVNRETTIKFLRQFLVVDCNYVQLKDLIDGVLRLLNSATFINRSFFINNMTSIMNEVAQKNYESLFVVKLGGFFDSSNRLSWFFNEINLSEKYSFCENVEEAIMKSNSKNSCICLFDDGAYSGTQLISIFQDFMGVKDGNTTDEFHANELSEQAKESLRTTKIILSYICFNYEKRDNILNQLKNLGITNVEIIYRVDLSRKVFDQTSTIFRNDLQKQLVKDNLNKIGAEIIYSNQAGHWEEQRIIQAALGYNDAQQMVIFDVNVPTYTISPFWYNGTYLNHQWRGLFQRTDNSKKTKKR